MLLDQNDYYYSLSMIKHWNIVPKIKLHKLKVKTAVMKWLKEQSTEFHEAGIYAFIRRWNIAIERNCDYVQKEGCDPQRTNFIFVYGTCYCVGNFYTSKEKRCYFLTPPVPPHTYIYTYIYITHIRAHSHIHTYIYIYIYIYIYNYWYIDI